MGRSLETLPALSKQLVEIAKRHPVATGVLLGAAANKLGSELVWGMKRRSELHKLPYGGPTTMVAGVVFPGMGNSGDGSRKMASQFSKVLPEQPWAYVQYDNSRRLHTDDLGNLLRKFQEETGMRFLDLFPSSMGFTVGIEAARKAGIPIRIMFINSSPSNIRDGYGSKAGVIAARLPDTGLIGKFAGTFIADTIRPGGTEVRANLAHAARETLRGGSPKLFKSQFEILQSVDLEKDWENYRDIIDPSHTVAVYVAPKAKNDNTVRVDQGYLGLQRFFYRLGVTLDRLEMPFANHADTEEAIRVGNDWLMKTKESTTHLLH